MDGAAPQRDDDAQARSSEQACHSRQKCDAGGCVLTVRGGDTLTRALTTPQLRHPLRHRRDRGWCSRCAAAACSLRRTPLRHLHDDALTEALAVAFAVFVLTRRAAVGVVQFVMAQVDGAIDVSHVCKLTRAVSKREFGGHHARAAELYGRALAAAEELRQPDCLIVASLRCWCMAMQHNMTCDALSGDDSADSERRAVAPIVALYRANLPGVLETLERRRAAGTLLPDCCRAHEVTWYADIARADPIPCGEKNGVEVSISLDACGRVNA